MSKVTDIGEGRKKLERAARILRSQADLADAAPRNARSAEIHPAAAMVATAFIMSPMAIWLRAFTRLRIELEGRHD